MLINAHDIPNPHLIKTSRKGNKSRTDHVHVVVVEFDILRDDGLDNGVDDSDQHKEEHNEMHVAGAHILLLETDCVGVIFFAFCFLEFKNCEPSKVNVNDRICLLFR